MIKPSVRRPVSWMLLVGLLILVFALSACGEAAAPSKTVNIKETKGASGDVYSCDPASITVNKGETVNFTNQSDENQDFDAGDAKLAGVDFKIGLNQTVPVTFNNVGTFTIKSEKGGAILATITVTVK